ncbi:upstream stimulatory factor 2 isoform 1 [Lynx pardinus]|uniref:Upstream stimulatory factor 2 isoform 1 n=1 Tax=Lynx pardinus TaxID=191816 RepID=A0A485NMW2_LYNPA|nr:upstream stimulatory factor 2 isoform 1 [Lynx pardinus]
MLPLDPLHCAVIQNPFSNGGSPAAEAVSGEARFAYFPASSVGDTTAVSVQTTDQSLQAGGQFYVMMTPQDVLQTGTQRTIAPRTHPYSPKIDGTRTPRDERRRAQHNEDQRRARSAQKVFVECRKSRNGWKFVVRNRQAGGVNWNVFCHLG